MTIHRTSHLDDPGAKLLDQWNAIFGRYGRIVLIAVAAVAVAGALGFLYKRSRDAAEQAAAAKLAEANMLFWQGEYTRSLEIAKQVAQQYGSTPSGNDAHRLAGDNAYWNGDFKAAVDEYKVYLSHAKKGMLADAAGRSLAYALESSGRNAEAAQAYESLVGKFDRNSSAEFLAAAARCQRAAGDRAKAVQYLQRLVNEFGETNEANLARVQIAELSAAG